MVQENKKDKEIKMPILEDILNKIPKENQLSDKDVALLEKAFNFAKKAHEGHFRKSGEPYFIHCVETAKNVTEQNMGVETITAGLLHDTLDDAEISEETLKIEFGEEIFNLVKGVSKLSTIKYKGVERHAESMRKFFVALADDIRVVVIKLCDRLHNVSTLEYIEEKKRERIALETLEIHARLADRIGMGKLKGDLEDAAFPYAHPEDFKKVKEMFDSVSNASEEYLLKVLEKVKEALDVFEIKYTQIDHRLKHLYSLYEKLKKFNWNIQKIYDIAAMRIIVSDIATCYQALGVIHGLYKPVPGRFKDYIALPKPNGYQSLHTTVFDGKGGSFEVQIRTEEMHKEAEYGAASHLAYKEVGDSKEIKNEREKSKMNNLNQKIAWTKELFQPQDIDSENKDFIKNIKEEFFDETLFIHTPKGDVIEMPKGSGVIDFAYMVHSDIGNHISGVMVDGKMVSLDTRLKDGNLVEIITKEDAQPTHKWLNYANTALAKRHIRNKLREQGKDL